MAMKKRARPSARVAVVLSLALAAAGGAYALLYEPDRSRPERVRLVDACDIEPAYLQRLWRGYTPYRSGDVLLIERYPNGFGKRHASPFPYTQDVPLVLYGPGFIRPGRYEGEATHADLAPTFAELLGFDAFPERDGGARRSPASPGRAQWHAAAHPHDRLGRCRRQRARALAGGLA
jgi:hypothetical protein